MVFYYWPKDSHKAQALWWWIRIKFGFVRRLMVWINLKKNFSKSYIWQEIIKFTGIMQSWGRKIITVFSGQSLQIQMIFWICAMIDALMTFYPQTNLINFNTNPKFRSTPSHAPRENSFYFQKSVYIIPVNFMIICQNISFWELCGESGLKRARIFFPQMLHWDFMGKSDIRP